MLVRCEKVMLYVLICKPTYSLLLCCFGE